MSLIQHFEIIRGSTVDLFDLTQDYARRLEWDPFPDRYEFHDGAARPDVGVELSVQARNGYSMRVRYVSFNRPHAAAIEMVSGPWFIARFAGAWNFSAIADGLTRVTFKYNVAASPSSLGLIVQPILNWSMARHTKRRLLGLKVYSEQSRVVNVRA